MFGFPHRGYRQSLDEVSKLPHIEVTTEEFVKMLVAAGQTEEKAKSQANFAKGLGSSIRIGDQMVGVKDV